MNNLILSLFSACIFIFYNIYVTYKYGLLPSISDSFYKHKSKPLFAFFIWLTVLPLIIVSSTPLMFASGAFLCYVGASPNFKTNSGLEDDVHYFGALLGIIFGYLSMIIEYNYIYLSISLVVLNMLIYILKIKNKLLFVEYSSFLFFMIIIFIERILMNNN